MQTFLPYEDFVKSAKCLDSKRLGKQRIEVIQILKALKQGPLQTDPSWAKPLKTPWYNHPAVQMWGDNQLRLIDYGLAICSEWMRRGFKDNCGERMLNFIPHIDNLYDLSSDDPDWLGNVDFHNSHKSNLLRKDPAWYGKFGWKVHSDLPYFWPTKNGY